MNKRTRIALAGALAAILAGGSLAVAATTTGAQADGTVPWTDPHRVTEALQLLDAAGHPVTYGRLDQPIAASATTTASLGTGTSVGTLFLYTPGTGHSGSVTVGDGSAEGKNSLSTDAAAAGDANEVGSWTGLQLDASTPFTGSPKAALGADAITVAQYVAGYPNALADTASKDVYEVRLRTSSPNASATALYAAADIVVSGDTWHLYGDEAPTGTVTKTTLAVTPATVVEGGSLTLTAGVTAGATGSVEFFDNGTKVGATQPVASGTAAVSVPSATVGDHTFSAVFTGTGGALNSSDGVSYTVAPKIAAPTTTSVQVTSAAGKRVGESLDLRATVAPAAAGSVQFRVGGTNAGTPVAVDGSGVATTTYTPTAAGEITVSATFTPSAPADFAPSASVTPATYTVLGPDTSAADAKAAQVAAAQAALDQANAAVVSATQALNAAATPKAVKAYVKALAAQAKAQAKVTAAQAKSKAAKTSKAKKKAKKTLAKVKKSLSKAKTATKKAKKKAGSAAKKYDSALAIQKAAQSTQAAKAAALAAAKAS